MSSFPQAVDEDSSRRRSPLKFFVLVFVLTIPFWLAGAFTSFQLLPGLSVAALAFLCPVTAALILVYGESRTAGMIRLLKRSFDFQRIRTKVWLIPVILLSPAVGTLSYVLIRWMGVSLPIAQFPILPILAMLVVFFLAAVGEELGWSGYVTDPMQDRWGALQAGILVGLVWAVWHFVALVQVHRSPGWIAWWSLGTVSQRVLIVWLYNNTGKSVFAAAVFHAMGNLTWQLFPINGSYFDPRVNGLIMAFVAVIVAAIWGPRTLARSRYVNVESK